MLARLAREKGIDMPVVAAVDKLLSGRAGVDQVLQELLARPPRPEASQKSIAMPFFSQSP